MGDVSRGVRAVILERFAGQLVLIPVAVTVLLVLPSPVLSKAHLGMIPRTVAGIAAAGVLAAVLFILFIAWLRREPGASRWDRGLRRTVQDIRLGLLARDTWPGVVVSSVVVLAGHLATFLVAARAAGATAPTAQLLPLMVLALLAMMLPLNIGGWGPREGVTAWAFGAAGLGAAQGLTVAVVYGLLAFVASLPGAGVLVGAWILRLRAARTGTDAPATDGPVTHEPVTHEPVTEVPVTEVPVTAAVGADIVVGPDGHASPKRSDSA